MPLLLAACLAHPPAPVSERSLVHGEPPDVYTVREYDTLYSVAWRYELDADRLAVWNGLEPPYLIKAGQRLALNGTVRLPQPAGPDVPAAAPAKPLADPPVEPAKAAPVTAPPASKTAPVVDVVDREMPPKPTVHPTPEPVPAAPVRSRQAAPPAQPAADRKPPAAAPRNVLPAAAADAWRWPVAAKPGRVFGGGSKGFDYALPKGTAIQAATPGVVVYSGPGLGGFRHLVIVKASDRHLVAYGINVRPNMEEGDTVRVGDEVARAGGGRTGGQFHFEIRQRVAADGSMQPVDPNRFIGR